MATSSILHRRALHVLHPKRKKRIVVALSGGVDSSVAAHLLQQQQQEQNDDTSNPNKVKTEIMGLFMNNWNDDDSSSYCLQSEEDCNDAKSICDHLNIPFHHASFASEYWTEVFDPFLNSIGVHDDDGNGGGGIWNMPNPDMDCNRFIKFGVMKEYMKHRLDADYIATGHYARLWNRHTRDDDDLLSSSAIEDMVSNAVICNDEDINWIETWGRASSSSTTSFDKTDATNLPPLLLSAADGTKDQSYFLSMVSGEAFRNVLFPLGPFTKKTHPHPHRDDNDKQMMSVREIASSAGLITANKKESMGICMVKNQNQTQQQTTRNKKKKRGFKEFIAGYFPPDLLQPGNFVDVDTGKIIGTHNGNALLLTIGQGAKIGGASQKWFVVGRQQHQLHNHHHHHDNNNTTVFVCGGTHHPALYTDNLVVKEDHFSWIAGVMPPPLLLQTKNYTMEAYCRIRHLQPLVKCEVQWNISKNQFKIRFHKPLRGVTPGQTVAIYAGAHGLFCLGGGNIHSRGLTYHERGLDLPSKDGLHPAGNNDVSLL